MDVVYEGELVLEKYKVLGQVYYFKLIGPKLIFLDPSTRKKVGVFHMGISEIDMSERDSEIRLFNGVEDFVLRLPSHSQEFELKVWFQKLKEMQNEPAYSPNLELIKQQSKKSARTTTQKVKSDMGYIWGLTTNIEEILHIMALKLENNNLFVDYTERLFNFVAELKKKLKEFGLNLEQSKGGFGRMSQRSVVVPEYQRDSFESLNDIPIQTEQRDRLPSIIPAQPPLDFAALLRNYKNKYFDDIPFPIIAFEPLSYLQRLAQQFENAELLNKADIEKEPCLRMAYVIAFALVIYEKQKPRLRIPFECMQGEVFSYFDLQSKTEINAEAIKKGYHARLIAKGRNFEFQQETKLIGKFYGNTFEFKTTGLTKIRLNNSGDIIQYRRPNMLLREAVSVKPYLDLCGDMTFQNQKLNIKGHVAFEAEEGSFVAKITQGDKGVKVIMGENWGKLITVKDMTSKRKIQLWKAHQVQRQSRYGFTQFAMQLNYLTPVLQKTISDKDSRKREDIKLLEMGQIKNAQARHMLYRDRVFPNHKNSLIGVEKI